MMINKGIRSWRVQMPSNFYEQTLAQLMARQQIAELAHGNFIQRASIWEPQSVAATAGSERQNPFCRKHALKADSRAAVSRLRIKAFSISSELLNPTDSLNFIQRHTKVSRPS